MQDRQVVLTSLLFWTWKTSWYLGLHPDSFSRYNLIDLTSRPEKSYKEARNYIAVPWFFPMLPPQDRFWYWFWYLFLSAQLKIELCEGKEEFIIWFLNLPFPVNTLKFMWKVDFEDKLYTALPRKRDFKNSMKTIIISFIRASDLNHSDSPLMKRQFSGSAQELRLRWQICWLCMLTMLFVQ